jgi:arylsulfatase A-like enzyme
MWAYYGDPHAPYLRHRSVASFGPTPSDVYDGEVAFTDRHIGRLLDALQERGLADDTIVVLTSDHGEGLDPGADHGHLFHGPTLYDEVIRVPLIVRGPGYAPRRVQTPVSLIDLPPTFQALLGQPPAPELRGLSLVPWLAGDDPPHPPVFFEKQKESALPQKGMVLWPYKVILVLPYNRIRIYNLAEDPAEQRELKKELPPEDVRRLVGLLKYWSNEVLVPVEPTAPRGGTPAE